MEIYLEENSKNKKLLNLNSTSASSIRIVSIDEQDLGKFYLIPTIDIMSIDEDCEGLNIWWKQYNPLEGRNFTCSAHFKDYELI